MAEPSPRPRWYALDARSLAALRIGLVALVLLDLALRSTDLVAHYTDLGVLPRALVPPGSWDFGWSLHRLGGSAGFEATLFALHALAAGLLLLGWRTFWTSLLTAVLTISLHGRNPLLRDGQDDLLRVLLVWGVLLPWGSRWSLDARRGRAWHPLGSPVGSVVETAGTAGYLLQLLVVYWASAIAKLESTWWRSGEALSLAMSISRYETTCGQWLLRAPALLHAATFAVLAFELLAPVVVLLRRDARWRTAEVVAFWGLHAGMASVLRLGLFPSSPRWAGSRSCPAPSGHGRRRPPRRWSTGGRRPSAGRWSGRSSAWSSLQRHLPLARPGGLRLGAVQTTARCWGCSGTGRLSPAWWTTSAEVDGWLSVVGDRADNHSVDILAGGPPSRTARGWGRRLPQPSLAPLGRGPLGRARERCSGGRWRSAGHHDAVVVPGVELVASVERAGRGRRVTWFRQRLGHPEDVPEPLCCLSGSAGRKPHSQSPK
jgi:hypothetical protein